MSEAVIHLTKCSDRSTLASARIAKFLAKALSAPLVDNQYGALAMSNMEVQRIFVVNSPLAFCDFREAFYALCNAAKEVIWVQNDYAITIPSQVRNKVTSIWSSVEAEGNYYINWNKLSSYQFPLMPWGKRVDGVFYFGAWRKNRELYFQRYLQTDKYPVIVSTSNKGMDGFCTLNPKPKLFKPFENPAQLMQFKTTIYMEDTESHSLYCSPANRFYECLSAGMAIFFDKNSMGTMKKAGYDVSNYVVRGPSDVVKMLSMSELIAKTQYEMWFKKKNYIDELEGEVLELAKG